MTEIRTTHVGSLPRPADLTSLLTARDRGESVGDLRALVRDAVAEVVSLQRDAGIDVVNDGEAGRIAFTTYVTDRLDGFGGASDPFTYQRPEELEFPEYFARLPQLELTRPACVGPVQYRDLGAVKEDIATLKAVLGQSGSEDAFMTAASPGVISITLQNRHYANNEEYIWALADAMKAEYDAITEAGLILQLDCPDLAVMPLEREQLELHVEAINHATRDIPPERMRLHVCWGNHEGPHNHDVPLANLIDVLLTARPAGLSFEGANPRHAHEWRVFQNITLPEEKVLIPGVIDSTTNYIEHPQLIADRIATYAALVGPERVIAGADCGFASLAHYILVDPKITWQKLRALSDGAALASRALAGAGRN